MAKIRGYLRYYKRPEDRIDDTDPADLLHAYRADPTGKFGGKDGLETQPISISYSDLYESARGVHAAQQHGLRQIPATELANRALLEGRGDGGANGYDRNNPRARALAEKVRASAPENLDTIGPKYAAAVLEKQEVAKRLNIPFEKAWIGTGRVTANYGGDEYAARAKEHYAKGAPSHPKNAEMMAVIERGLRGEDDPRGLLQAREGAYRTIFSDKRRPMGEPTAKGYKQAVLTEVMSDPNATKGVNLVQPAVLQHFAENDARKRNGLPTKPYGTTQVVDEADGWPRKPTSTERTYAEIIGSLPSVQSAVRRIAGAEQPAPEGVLDRTKQGLRRFFGMSGLY